MRLVASDYRDADQRPGGGRYQLFAANRYGGDLYVSINLEYVIQFGAACELVAFYGWSPQDVEVELGEFDALGRGRSRVLLAMEAKARIEGPDSLSNLWHSFIGYASADVAPNPVDNHSRKYTELLRLTADGPVVLWLVAAQARWSVLATRVGSRIEFGQCPTVAYDDVVRSVERADAQPATRPSREHEAE